VKVSNEVKVAALGIVGLVILYFGVRFLKGVDMFTQTNTFYVVYENIDGLKVSNPVILNGYPVGRVKNILLKQGDGNVRIVVEMEIGKEIQFSEETIALLTDPSLLGDKAIELKIGAGKRILQEGDTLKGEVNRGLTDQLLEKASPMLNNLGTMLENVNSLLVEYKGMGEKVQVTMENAASFTAKANQLNVQQVNQILADFKKISTELAILSKDLQPMMAKLNSLTDSLNAVPMGSIAEDLGVTLQKLQTTLDAINATEGTIGALMNDKRLYEDLDQTLISLDSLLVDFREHPKRYVHFSVFGKKDKKK
jgi:phospholipid/cholesterol/gamma-HCH transport system substrate-binding protein